MVDSGPPRRDCLEDMNEVLSSQPDLTNQPIGNPDFEYFTDGSSFIQDGTHFAGYAIITLDSVIESTASCNFCTKGSYAGTQARYRSTDKHLH
jgi:hypothetical protein